jgi:hypothetical protein
VLAALHGDRAGLDHRPDLLAVDQLGDGCAAVPDQPGGAAYVNADTLADAVRLALSQVDATPVQIR